MPIDARTSDLLGTLLTLVEPSEHDPSTQDEVAAAEAQLGRPLPDELRWWVTHTGSTYAVGGDLSLDTRLFPQDDDDRNNALTSAADQLRAWDWEIPEELIVIGGNGGGDPFGIWAPASGGGIPAVVSIGAGHSADDPHLWIVGDSLSGFLRGWIATYAYWLDDPEAVYRSLGIPEALWPADEEFEEGDPRLEETSDDDGAEARALLRFTSPSLGDWVSEPWFDERPLSPADLRQALTR